MHLIVDQGYAGSNPVGSANSRRAHLNGRMREIQSRNRGSSPLRAASYGALLLMAGGSSFKAEVAVQVRCAPPTYYSLAFISESEVC